ncbi:MAG: preprotein translocase subunit YajC [Anaerovoracaceae bacterium]
MKYLFQFGPLVILLILMYFILIRPQKKKEKEITSMRNSLNVGDEIITIGGICGKIVKTKDETIVIQVGVDKVKFEMMRWSVSKVVSSSKRAVKEDIMEEEPKKALPKRIKKAEQPKTEVTEEVTEEVTTEETEK